jgi:hypothetical protein
VAFTAEDIVKFLQAQAIAALPKPPPPPEPKVSDSERRAALEAAHREEQAKRLLVIRQQEQEARRFRQLCSGAAIEGPADLALLRSRTSGQDQQAAAKLIKARWDSGEIDPDWYHGEAASEYTDEQRKHAQELVDAARPEDVQGLADANALAPLGVGDGRDRNGLRRSDYRGQVTPEMEALGAARKRARLRRAASAGGPPIPPSAA